MSWTPTCLSCQREKSRTLQQSISGNFTHAEAEKRKTQDMLNIETLGVKMTPKFHVLWKSKAFPKTSANSQMASTLLVKFDGKLRLQLLHLTDSLAILSGLFCFQIDPSFILGTFPHPHLIGNCQSVSSGCAVGTCGLGYSGWSVRLNPMVMWGLLSLFSKERVAIRKL